MGFTMVGDMDRDAGAVVLAAAMQTMRGGAHVTLSCGMSVPEFEGNAQYVGIVDFDGDRCRLDGQADAAAQAMAFDGPVSCTRQADGRWTSTKGAPGTHNMFDPRWALEALAHAQRSAVATATHVVELELEYETLNAGTDIGLSRDWDESTAVVQLTASGRIARATLTHRSHRHPDAWMRFDYQITESPGPAPVELPKPEATIPLTQYLAGADGEPDR
jgi:hypothetical protein